MWVLKLHLIDQLNWNIHQSIFKKKAFSEPTLADGNRNWNKILSRAAHSQSQKQAVDLPLQILTWTEASESASSCPPDGDSELWPPAEPH